MRVSVKDASQLVNQGLSRMFERHPSRVELVEWAPELATSPAVDVILVDGTERASVLVGLDRLVAATSAKVVPFVWEIDADDVAEAVAAGAAGYLWKGLSTEDLLAALEEICWGEALPRPAKSLLYRQVMAESGLSKREFEVLTLIARGVSNQEIADQAFLSINSVKSYIRVAYRKIGVTRRTQAVSWALQQGLGEQSRPPEVMTPASR